MIETDFMDTDESGHIFIIQKCCERLQKCSYLKICITPLHISKNINYNPCEKGFSIIYQEQITNIKNVYYKIVNTLVSFDVIYCSHDVQKDICGYITNGNVCIVLQITKHICQEEQYRQYYLNDEWINHKSEIVSLKTKNKYRVKRQKPSDIGKPGYIYLLWPKEYLDKEEYTYKIGRTSQEKNKRFYKYINGTIIVYQEFVNNNIFIEKVLINSFKVHFKQSSRGNEYFNGNVMKMLEIMKTILQQEHIM